MIVIVLCECEIKLNINNDDVTMRDNKKHVKTMNVKNNDYYSSVHLNK